MANNKYLDSTGVKYLWDKAKGLYQRKEEGKGLSTNDFSTEEKEKLAGLENYELPAASANDLGGIKIGEGLAIDGEGVVHTVYNPEMPVDWDIITDKPTTLEGYGITDAIDSSVFDDAIDTVNDDITALDNKIEEVREEVTKVYKYKGSVSTVADLDNIQNPDNGDVYDVEEDGMNYAWNEDENRWDNLGSMINIESITNEELDIITGSASSETTLRTLFEEGGEVSLAKDLSLTASMTTDKDTILDLDGHTLTYNSAAYALVADGATLTIKNGNISSAARIAQAENGGEVIIESGTFNAGDVALSAVGEGSKVIFNGGDLTAVEGGIGAFDKAFIEVNGGRIAGTDNFPLFTNGTSGRGGNTIVFNDGELVGNITSNTYESCGVYIANNDTFVMNGGTIRSTDGCGILMRAGNVTINGGEVIAEKKESGSHSPGYVGDKKKNMSASAVIYDEASNYPGKAGMSLVINGGTFIGVDYSVEVLSNEVEPNVTVVDGDFIPPYHPVG